MVGGMHGRGHAWQGVCIVGGMLDRGVCGGGREGIWPGRACVGVCGEGINGGGGQVLIE